MLSRRYLQSHLPVVIVAFTVLLSSVLCVNATESDNVILPPTSQNETDSGREHSQGSETGPPTSNEADTSTETTATPALSSSLFPSTTEAATTDLPSSSSYSAEKSTVTILPSTISLPSMIITATKVTLGHRMLPPPEQSTESTESSTESPAIVAEESSTNTPSDNIAEESFPMETIVSLTDSSGSSNTNIQVESPNLAASAQNTRQSRYHRYHDDNYVAPAEEDEQKTDYPNYRNNDFHETSTEFYREMEVEGGDSYGDFGEDNDLTEHLPTPMALINPNGEGNNPPLEDDFAEAFKKVNSNGKRRRFRGGRRGRMKLKRLNDTNDSNASGSTNTEKEENPSGGSKSIGSEWSAQPSTTEPPSTVSPKFKRYRSTTPFYGRSTTTTPSSVTTETPNDDGSPVVRNGPKPMILQSVNWDDSNSVTPVPQIEKPGNGGHTEKISTYFFSTPSPSARLRLRQKIRESLPTSSSTTTTTTTTTEAPAEDIYASFPSADNNDDSWKKEFSEFPQNPFFSEDPSPQTNFKIPEFVPLNLGLETDDRQEQVENSLSRPDPAEKKTYTLNNNHNNMENYDTSYSGSSTTPKSHKVRRPATESYYRHGNYETKPSRVSPTAPEVEKPVENDYYNQGSNTEPSPTFTSSSHRPTTGSHYDRTKDKVIFFNDSPYSTQHSSTLGLADTPKSSVLETTPGSSAQTVGSHLSVSEGPSFYESPLSSLVTVDHHYPSEHNQVGMFTRGQVYPADDVPQLDSTYKNGPPDSSHIHSPNIVELAQPQTSPTELPSDPNDLQHLQHHPHHNNHQQGSYSQTYLEDSRRQSMGRPGGDTVYGTVEEVPTHNPASFDHLNAYRHHPMHPHPPPPGHIPYPFGSEHPRSPPLHAPAMHYPPHNSFPFGPPPHASHHGEHGLPTHPMPPPPLPPPPPPQSNMHAHHPHHHSEIHNSFAPSYEMHPSNNHNNQHDSHLISNHIAGSPSEMSHPHGIPPDLSSSHIDPMQQHLDGHQSGTSSSPTAASPPEPPPSLISDNAAPPNDADPQTSFNNAQPPPPPPHMDHNFPPHSHTMASHPDYEPANPPLPHDHPFHNNFIPFPPQDILQQHEHHGGHDDTNSIATSGSSSGSYHPGIVESVPTGRPSSFEPSPLIPSKFTPIPDDVKETELFSSFKAPNEGPSPHHDQSSINHEGPSPSNQIPDIHQSSPHHPQHLNDQGSNYMGPTGADDHSSYQHHQHHDPSSVGPSGSDHITSDMNGYSGPVNEIHSGQYHPPSNAESPSHSYHNQDNHHSYDHTSGGGGYNSIHDGSPGSDYKPGDFDGHEKPHHEDHDGDTHANEHGPYDMKNSIHGGSEGKKEKKKQQAAFSNTPYVLMFPQLIPEEKMRPSPPSLLSKEIPVIQASSMSDFTSSGEKSPLSPGFQAVPVHPRHQMYQVLAKTHYEKMMERYRESKKKAPSAIYTPYGILVPVGTNVDAAASMNHNVFAKPRLPPKYRGEKSLLNALLGSPSTNHGRFHPPVMSNRLTKMFEYEPAIDVLAEKLAMKIVNAQRALSQKKPGHAQISEKSDGKSDDPSEKSSSPKTPSLNNNDQEDHMAMESKTHSVRANPELKDYFKGVLKGHLTEMVETSVSVEDTRRPPTLSSKLLNSFFRKGRLSMNQPPQHKSPSPMMMQPSGSMIMPNKVPPPPGLQTQPHSPHHHTGIGHPYPHPILPQGPGGLLGTIRRLFSFTPPDTRYDIGLPPNFAGRTLYTNNGTHLPYIDGPSPRSSHFPPQIILPHPNMIHQYPPGQQHLPMRIPTGPAPPPTLLSSSATNNNGKPNHNNPSSSQSQKSSKKKRKPQSSSSSSSKKPTGNEDPKWQSNSNNRQSSPTSFSPSPKINNTPGSSQAKTTTTTPKPNIVTNKSNVGYYHRSSGSSSNSNINTNNNSTANTSSTNSKQVLNKKSGISSGSSSSTSYMTDKSSSKVKGGSYHDSSSTKTEIVLNKRLGIQTSSSSSSSTSSSSSNSSDKKEKSKPTKLDMFQTLLGSTRSVLNYFKAAEARKSSGGAPTVLEPRSAATSTFVVEESKPSVRKRRSPAVVSS